MRRVGNIFLIVALAVGGVFVAYQIRHAMSDDAFITMRIVRNALEGRGLRFNQGDIGVQAATSPMNLLLMLLVSGVLSLFGVSAQTAVMSAPAVIAGFALPALGIGVYLLCRARENSSILAFAAAVAVMFSPFVLSTIGLETILLCALMVWAGLAYASEKWRMLGVLLGLAFLARHDALILVFIFVGAAYFESIPTERPKRLSSVFVPILLLVAPWLAFSAIYYHATIPTTLQSKLAQGGTMYWPGHYYDQLWPRLLDAFFGLPWLFISVLIAAVIGVWLGIANGGRYGKAVGFIASYGVLHIAAYSLMRLPDYHWYYVPYAVILFIAAGYGLARLAAKVDHFAIALLLGAAVAWLSFPKLPTLDPRYGLYRTVGAYLSANAPKTAVGIMEIGIIGFYSPGIRIFDFSGIATPEQVRRVRENDATGWLEDSTVADKVVIRAQKHPLEPDIDPRFFAQFEHEWTSPGNELFPDGLQVWHRKSYRR